MSTNQTAQQSTGAQSIAPQKIGSSTSVNNTYINSDIEDDNNWRPWTSGATPNYMPAATILLFQGANSAYRSAAIASLDGLTDSSGRSIAADQYLGVFKNFSLTRYSEGRQEAYNIQRTFGKDWVAFFFGEQPRIYQYEGHFLDYVEYPFYQQFMAAYDNYLRGTKCIENQMTMYISCDGKLIRGLMLNINTSKASAPGLPAGVVQFNFTILVMGDQWVRNSQGVYSNADMISNLLPFTEERTRMQTLSMQQAAS